MNLLLLLILILQKKMLSIKLEEIKRAISHHSTVIQSISKSFSSKILSLSQPLPSLLNAILCTTLMAVNTPEGKNYSCLPTQIGTGKDLLYPTQPFMPNKLMILLNIYLHISLTSMEKKFTTGSLRMQ